MTSYGFLSTYPPTRCGLATFTESLATAMAEPGLKPARIVRVVDDAHQAVPAMIGTRSIIVGDLVADDERSGFEAAQLLNAGDVAIIQHEYGIYGGPDGDDVLRVLRGLTVPSVVVLHTVLDSPTPRQKLILEQVSGLATQLVVMTQTAYRTLQARYDVDLDKTVIIPHGVAEWAGPTVLPRSDTRTVLTWGLIGPGKGIEWAIRAMAQLSDLTPSVHYQVLGQTHPKVLAHSGDAYRDSLHRLIDELGVGDVVTLDGDYQDSAALAMRLRASDVVLLPYDSRSQVTSGVLVEAIAAGKPVVATAFPHATELLSDGDGRVVAHENPDAIAAALRDVLATPALGDRLAAAARHRTAQTSWPAVAQRYRTLASGILAAVAA